MLPSYFNYIFVQQRQKGTYQAQIKPEVFVNFRPEPGRKSTRKAQPDLQLWTIRSDRFYFHLRNVNKCLIVVTRVAARVSLGNGEIITD